MAHELAMLKDRIMMSYQGETPWHSLGTKMIGHPDVPAALEAASLNWNVELQDMFLKNGTKVPRKRAVVRDTDGQVLASVGGDYVPLQNSEAFGVLQPACEQLGVTIESAGALGNGERVWMQAKLPESIEVVAGDRVDGFFLISSGHNGKIRYRARSTPQRVVCDNTLAIAHAGGIDLINLVHSRTTKDQLSMVANLVTNLVRALKQTGETFSKMAAKKMSFLETEQYIAEVLGVEADEIEDLEEENEPLFQRFNKMVDLSQNGRGAEFAPRTLWSAFNGISEFTDHVAPGLARSGKAVAAANRSAVFGKNAKLKNRALSIAQKIAA